MNPIYITNHYRHSLLFDQTLRLILADGGPVVVQSTAGPNPWGPLPPDIIEQVQYRDIGHQSYDAGMSRLKADGIPAGDPVVLLDNDCFISDLNQHHQYLAEFAAGGYDCVVHTVGNDANAGKYTGQIAPILNLTLKPPSPADDQSIMSPDPHFENAYLIYSRAFWDALTPHDLSHHRRMLMAAVRHGARLGSHKANYRWGYSQWGNGWHHIGNLFPYHEKLELDQAEWFKPDSEFDRYRAGYFAQQAAAGLNPIPHTLNRLFERYGGREGLIETWNQINQQMAPAG